MFFGVCQVPYKRGVVMSGVVSLTMGNFEELLRKNQAEVLHMLLTEYDEKRHMESIYKEGKEAGYSRGQRSILERQVRKKLERGKSIAMIAEELEEEAAVIEEIADKVKTLSP